MTCLQLKRINLTFLNNVGSRFPKTENKLKVRKQVTAVKNGSEMMKSSSLIRISENENKISKNCYFVILLCLSDHNKRVLIEQ